MFYNSLKPRWLHAGKICKKRKTVHRLKLSISLSDLVTCKAFATLCAKLFIHMKPWLSNERRNWQKNRRGCVTRKTLWEHTIYTWIHEKTHGCRGNRMSIPISHNHTKSYGNTNNIPSNKTGKPCVFFLSIIADITMHTL